ncbi:MAG: TIGR00730 family Rossman fold protein [Bacteroidaceae bacterium]|nr:TIGR00730 family Rossman fold protein [Bacteroidaceae bacterium]
MKNIGLFCAASEKIEPVYAQHAREFGKWIGEQCYTLIYGGAAKGLMEATAAAAKEHGAHVVGVVPEVLIERGSVSKMPNETITVANLSERKDVILAKSDILVALPGGIGTLDEVFHVMAAAIIGFHDKKVVFYNVNGFWDSMATLLQEYKSKNFLRGETEKYFAFADSFEQLIKIIEQ